MRVLIVNTSERTGGAAVAAHRLMDALNNHGVKAKMLVRDKETDSLTVIGLRGKWRQQWSFLWERFVIFLHLHLKRQRLFEIDIANAGTDITRLREFQEADVIHLHWVNQGMLSLSGIGKILNSGPPPPSATMPGAVRTTRRPAATVRCCRAAVATCPVACGDANSVCSTAIASVSWLAASGSAARQRPAPCCADSR